MPTKSPCHPIDFSPLATDAPKTAKHVAIIIAPNGEGPSSELPFTGVIAVDGKRLVHASLDALGAGPFFAEAIARVTSKWPRARVHSMAELGWGDVATGVVVPCPPRPPRHDLNVAALGKLFAMQKELLQPSFEVAPDVDIPVKNVPAKITGKTATATATATAKPPLKR